MTAYRVIKATVPVSGRPVTPYEMRLVRSQGFTVGKGWKWIRVNEFGDFGLYHPSKHGGWSRAYHDRFTYGIGPVSVTE